VFKGLSFSVRQVRFQGLGRVWVLGFCGTIQKDICWCSGFRVWSAELGSRVWELGV
jgi:hypothetical protein